MTVVEAETGAAERHEFRGYIPVDHPPGVLPECWCGWAGSTYASKDSARNAHQRHKERWMHLLHLKGKL